MTASQPFSRNFRNVHARIAAIAICALGPVFGAAAAPVYLSPGTLACSPDGARVYVAATTAERVLVFDVEGRRVTGEIPVPSSPGGLAMSADGATLYVTGATPEGTVSVVSTATGDVERSFEVGHVLEACCLLPDGRTLFVCEPFTDTVLAVDLRRRRVRERIPVLREPVALALTPDGATLVVANHLPAGRADRDYAAGGVSLVDTASCRVRATVALPNGSTDLRGVCVSPDGRFAYVTHMLGRYQLPTTQLERGWMNTSALSVIDLEGSRHLNTVLLDDVDLGAANPWAVLCTPDGRYLCVGHAGTHELSVIEREALHAKLDRVAGGEAVSEVSLTPADVPNDLSFLVGIRRRIRLPGNSPRSMILAAGSNLVIGEYFTDSLALVDLDSLDQARTVPVAVALGPEQPLTPERRGAMFFADAQFCFQNWQSCTSCHPRGRVDGLNWDLLNDGMGNPKQTKSLLLSHETPAAMVTGIRADAETAVRAGLKFIQFAVRPEEDAQAIDAYLRSMKPVPSPHLVKGRLSRAARRGERVFAEAGCVTCHPGPHFTDQRLHDVGVGVGREEGVKFDTPALVEIWRTAPYLYDGRAATIREVLTTYNPDDKHGVTSDLSKRELSDLEAYILSQ
jgi:YVTN family beta-propeller protein